MTPAVTRLVCLLAGLASSFASLATAASTNSAWHARTWQSDDGLPNNNVTSLAQTPDGYLWVATPSRLARFDGNRFEEFHQSSFAGHNQRITDILCTRDGSLWMPLDRGPIVRLHGGKAEVFTNNLPGLVVDDAIEDGEGALWVSYRGGRLRRIKDGKVFEFSAREGFPENYGGCHLARDQQGRLWLSKNGRIITYRNGRFEQVFDLANVITRLTGASDGGLWICSGMDLFKFDESRGLKAMGRISSEPANTYPATLLEDRGGALWIGTSSSGLFRFTSSGFERVPTSHRSILSLLQDREGNIWVGTEGGGLNRVQLRAFELQGGHSGLPFEAVQSICEDTAGTVWAATQNGLLVCCSNGVWNTLSTNPGWNRGAVTCVTADRDGGVWIAARNRLHYLRNGRFRTIGGLTSHAIHALVISTKGDLWIGSEIVEVMRGGKLIPFPLPAGTQVRAMAEDTEGNIWMGTVGGSLLRVSDDRVVDETTRILGVPDSIRCLYATPDGSVWVGFAAGGLGRIKAGRMVRIRADQGLGDDRISQIQPDGDGWFWIGADHGIFRMRQDGLDAVADGREPRVSSIHYARGAGLPSLQANFGATPGVLKTRDGRLWMPMRSALAVVDPTRLHDDLTPPRVLLKRIAVDDQPVAVYGGVMPIGDVIDLQKPKSTLHLPPGHRRLEFEFTALSFATPENVVFRYRLAGIDDHWNEANAERVASYSRLSAGHYRFEVSACQSGGPWNPAGSAFDFVVTPFFWETWWFRLSALAAFTAGAIGTGRYISFRRLRLQLRALEQQAALEKERARIAKDIHDDLGGSLTQATLLLALTLKDRTQPDKVTDHVQQIASTVRQVTESLDEIVWAANPRNDTLPDLLDYISLFAVQFLQTANIRCRIDSPQPLPNRPLSPEIRHGLFLVVKEALNNVVRHAEATEVGLKIVVTDESLSLAITDNGRGFEGAPRDGYADGLRNMRQRMTEIGGEFRIESRPGSGTQISVEYAWGK